MNVLYFILGLAMIGMSSWGITQQKDDIVTQCESGLGLPVERANGT
jgi:hypothetical protein